MTSFVAVKHTTTTTSVIWCRHDSNGAMTVECNGQTFAGGTVDTATDDGTAICTITGLSPNTRYTATVKVAGVSIGTVSIITNPVAGSTFTIGYSSCIIHSMDPIAYQALGETFPDMCAFVFGGDNIYAGENLAAKYTESGETILDVCHPSGVGVNTGPVISDPTDETITMASLYAHYHLWWNKASHKYIMRNYPSYFITDDHERPGNDWIQNPAVLLATRLAKANGFHTWATTELQLTNMALWCRRAWNSYFNGNPSNSTINSETPAWPASQQLYYDFVIGDAHILCLENTEYFDNANDMWGTDQLNWIKATIAASSSTWKILFVGKSPTDDFHYSAADALETWLAANATGVLIVGGDTHTSGMFWNLVPTLCSGPSGATINQIADGYTSFGRWKYCGYSSLQYYTAGIKYSLASFVRVHGATKLEYGIIEPSGEIVYSGEMLPSTNAISYPAQKFG